LTSLSKQSRYHFYIIFLEAEFLSELYALNYSNDFAIINIKIPKSN